jgi:acetyltransferase-like isoleucine patch superfamily enzyme
MCSSNTIFQNVTEQYHSSFVYSRYPVRIVLGYCISIQSFVMISVMCHKINDGLVP